MDSRLPLIRQDFSPLDVRPVFAPDLDRQLKTLVDERTQADRLLAAGLRPSRTALFIGPPGVGKTLAARWLAEEMGLPMLILDLSAVMSSFLGRTGVNVRRVLDYAKSGPCVLLLDELDAIAKRRDDATEVGELKRLVTVLLQEIDDWPDFGLLLAATNHPDLLDRAVWRRFDHVVEFPMPDFPGIVRALSQHFEEEVSQDSIVGLLARTLVGSSYSEIERIAQTARRRGVIDGTGTLVQLRKIVTERALEMPQDERIEVAVDLVRSGTLTQRKAHELVGVSRDTIRRRMGA